MKTSKTSFILSLVLPAAVALAAWSSTLWEGSLTTVNNTTAYTASNVVNAVSYPGGTYLVSVGVGTLQP